MFTILVEQHDGEVVYTRLLNEPNTEAANNRVKHILRNRSHSDTKETRVFALNIDVKRDRCFLANEPTIIKKGEDNDTDKY